MINDNIEKLLANFEDDFSENFTERLLDRFQNETKNQTRLHSWNLGLKTVVYPATAVLLILIALNFYISNNLQKKIENQCTTVECESTTSLILNVYTN